MELVPNDPPDGSPPPTPRPPGSGPSDRGLMIMVIVLGLAFMAFVLMAGVIGFTP